MTSPGRAAELIDYYMTNVFRRPSGANVCLIRYPGFHPGLAAGHPSGIHEFYSLFAIGQLGPGYLAVNQRLTDSASCFSLNGLGK